MQSIQEIGQAIAIRRRALGLQQQVVAAQAGIAGETLSRLERGNASEFGTRKLLAVLAVLGMELDAVVSGQGGTLDELRAERSRS